MKTDLSKYESAIDLEQPTLKKAKAIIKNHQLDMKLIDVEFQGDKSKAIFYSAIISEIIVIIIFFVDIIRFLWLNFIGAVLTILIAFLIQLLIKESKK